jgi:hypothetical protein
MSQPKRSKPLWDAQTPAIAPQGSQTPHGTSTVSIQAAEIDRLNAIIRKKDKSLEGIHKAFTALKQAVSTMKLLVPRLPSPKEKQ